MNSRSIAAILMLAASPAALAHVDGHAGGLASGFSHPFLGVDHLLAMLVVGVWAASYGGARRWILPVAFVTSMAAGAALGGHVDLPLVEPMIAMSLLVFGLAVAAAARIPAAAAAAVVAAFAVFHGHAHFAEMPPEAPAMSYAAGMLAATAMLHAAGLFMADAGRRAAAWIPRAAGALTGATGLALLVLK